MSEIVDEASYVHYAENLIFDLQRTFRRKPGVEDLPVIEISMLLEELCFNFALKECNASSGDTVWTKKGCPALYQRKCESMLRNLELKDYNWMKILAENKIAKEVYAY